MSSKIYLKPDFFPTRSSESESVSSNPMKKTLVFHNLVPEKGETGMQVCVVCNCHFLLCKNINTEKNDVDDFDFAGKKLRERIEDLLEVKLS